jgi:hypothetical protein
MNPQRQVDLTRRHTACDASAVFVHLFEPIVFAVVPDNRLRATAPVPAVRTQPLTARPAPSASAVISS